MTDRISAASKKEDPQRRQHLVSLTLVDNTDIF